MVVVVVVVAIGASVSVAAFSSLPHAANTAAANIMETPPMRMA
jgi:hypothetical protein